MLDLATVPDRLQATLEDLGTDLRFCPNRPGGEPYLRVELASKVVALLQSKTNVLLRGASGVGKTQLAHSLVRAEWKHGNPTETGQLRLVETNRVSAPAIIETNAARFIEGCRFCHDLENKMAKVLGLALSKPAILFIDPLDGCIGTGSSSSDPNTDVANLLIPFIDKGLRVIAAVTPDGEAMLRAANPRLLQRFVVVDVPEPDAEETRAIAKHRLRAMDRAGIGSTDDSLSAGLDLAQRFLPAVPRLAGFERLSKRAAAEDGAISPRSLRRAAAGELGVLPGFVGAESAPTHPRLVEQLSASVFGQHEAISEVADALCRFAGGLIVPGRPLASFLAAGPTGCGKTSLALATAEALTGSADAVVRVDMSEYADPFSADRLLGRSERSLVSRLESRPAGVLLLDEIEKAHYNAIVLFLQAIGEARLTGADGRTVRLDNYVVMVTTNVGARRWSLGMAPGKTLPLVMADIAEAFSKEFLARFTRTLVFEPLSAEAGAGIVTRELAALNEMPGVVERRLQLIWPDTLPLVLARIGVSAEKGARGVQGVVRALVATPLARWLAEHPESADGLVMLAPRVEREQIVSLTIDWVDHGGFFRELAN